MRYPSPLEEAVLLRRYKRFLVDIERSDGSVTTVHLANTGSMKNCLAPRAPVRVSWSDDPRRKLKGSVEQIRVDDRWIVVNTARPNAVVAEGIAAGVVPGLGAYDTLRREVRTPDGSRIDLRLDGPGRTWVEVKNVTLREGEELRFPDAVTTRGARHADTLRQLVEQGDRAVLLFHVGTEGGRVVHLADDIDPDYAVAVRAASAAGVEVIAHRCVIGPASLSLGASVPVVLG